MAISRYRKIGVLSDQFSYKLNPITKKKRTLTFYNSLKFAALENEAFDDLEMTEVVYKSTDTLMAISEKHYGDPAYWWVIALINNVGSERDIALGQSLVILSPVSAVIAEYDL